MTIRQALQIFGLHFTPRESWKPGFAFLAALFGCALDAEELEIFRKHTKRESAPTKPLREAWLVCGRRSGKSRLAALVAVYVACFIDYRKRLAPGERGVVMLLAVNREQAVVVFSYIEALLDAIPVLAQMIESRTAESIALAGRVSIEVHTSSYRSLRVAPSSPASQTKSPFGTTRRARTPAWRFSTPCVRAWRPCRRGCCSASPRPTLAEARCGKPTPRTSVATIHPCSCGRLTRFR